VVAFGFHHAMQRARESGQFDGFAGTVRGPIGLVPIRLVGGPLFDEGAFAADGVDGAGADGKALFRVVDGGGSDFLEAHGSPFFEDRESGVDGAGNHGGVEAVPGKRLIAREVPIDIHGVRGPALAHDGSNFPFLAGVDQHQSFAAEAVEILLQNTARQQRGYTGIEGIATLQQNAEGDGRRERMAGGYAAGRPHDGGPQGRTGFLAILNRDLSGSERGQTPGPKRWSEVRSVRRTFVWCSCGWVSCRDLFAPVRGDRPTASSQSN
jgi:hypothetical protein